MAHIADIIKYDGKNNTFIWKHPCEDFNSLTQLIVHESQEAIFFMNGEALDTFGPGRYTLETQNIPKIGKFINRTTDGETPFHCEVYFINKTVQMDIKWGTDSKVRYIDPASGIPLEIGASGSMNLTVSNGRKLLVKLVGTMSGITWGTDRDAVGGVNSADSSVNTYSNQSDFTKSLQTSFRPLISETVKANLSATVKALGVNIFEVDEHLTEIAAVLHEKLLPGFEEYGLTIPQFHLTTVVLPENDPNFKRVKDLYTIEIQKKTAAAEAEVRRAQAEAEASVISARRQAELEKQFTQTEIAKNEAERKIIAAQAEAQAKRMSGFADADVMSAMGYNQKDVQQTEIQKAYAAAMGQMGANLGAGGGSGSGGGGIASDMMSMMAGMKVADVMMGKMDGMFAGMNGMSPSSAPAESKAPAAEAKCPKCGAVIPENSKFCLECGEKVERVPEGMVVCPGCGKTVNKGKFCLECGYKFITACPKCGKEVPAGSKFCLECGEKI